MSMLFFTSSSPPHITLCTFGGHLNEDRGYGAGAKNFGGHTTFCRSSGGGPPAAVKLLLHFRILHCFSSYYILSSNLGSSFK